MHLNISSPGLGEARVVVLLRALDRRGDDLPLQLHAVRRGRPARRASATTRSPRSARRRRCGGCSSTPTSPAARARCARSSAPASRSTPRSSSRSRSAWGLTLRDGYGQTETTRPGRQHARLAGQAGLDGPAAARRPGGARGPADRRTRLGVDGRPGEGEICLDLTDRAAAADDRLPGRRRAQRRGDGRRFLPHRRRRDRRRATATSPTSAAPTTSSRPATTRSARSSSSRCSSSTPRWPRPRSCPRPTRCGWPSPRRTSSSRPGYEPTEETALSILGYAREHLAPWQRVRRIEFSELPKTISRQDPPGRAARPRGRPRGRATATRGRRTSGATTSSRSCGQAAEPRRRQPEDDDERDQGLRAGQDALAQAQRRAAHDDVGHGHQHQHPEPDRDDLPEPTAQDEGRVGAVTGDDGGPDGES